MSYWIVSYFLIVLLSKTNLAQDIQHMQVCIAQPTCKSCMEASNRCGWCSDWEYSNFTIGKPRCNIPERLIAFGCPLFAIKEATTGSVELLQDENFQDVIIDQIPVQLKPQKVRIKLRPLSEEILRIQYRPAKNYPLDLYYLMDLTWSMQDDKETLVGLGWNMAHTLGTFTNNFRLGFGSYADKPLMPYIFPGYEDNPCQAEHATCAPLYSFRHHMTLSGDVQEFIKKVNASDVTGNVDNLEGGLDGVVQAVVCGEQVGWRHQARKLMLVATDGSLHFAGDGKLGGVVHRQDFMCYLNSDGEYSMATKFDYPSLAEISRLLQFHKVNLIFAIGEDHREEYENIAELLKEKARVATLTGNSSNILEIIEQAYHEIVSKVILRDNSTESFNVEYFSNCGVQDGPQMQISECNGLLEGHVYDFDVKFSLKECPTNESLWRQIIVIDDALASEASEVIVEVELQCGCDCGTAINSKCINGINECGICKCDFGWSGETCNCNENSWTGNQQQCIYPGETELCSGRGECICGECSCDLGYNGLFCECSPCDKIDDVECSGRGSCDCGRCSCSTGWKGEGCQCPSGDNLCIPPGDNEVCAGHGYCDCGQCRYVSCNETAPDGLFYRGTYCEATAGGGGSGFCSFFVSCVNATIEEPTKARDLCHTNFSIFRTQRVSTLDSASDRYCFIRKVKDTTICTIPYVYEFNKDNTVTLNIGDKTCYTPMPAAFFPGIIFGAVVLFGIIALLIWKGWTIMKDKREYTKFEKERQQTIYSLNENPLYKPAISHFRVPSMIKED